MWCGHCVAMCIRFSFFVCIEESKYGDELKLPYSQLYSQPRAYELSQKLIFKSVFEAVEFIVYVKLFFSAFQ
jgi:hypothetical protein